MVKALLPRYFSFVAFATANILIDVEVLYYLYRRDPPLHRYCHTYLLATGIGVVTGLLTFLASCVAMRHLFHCVGVLRALGCPAEGDRTVVVCLVSGTIGGDSHVSLDSFMHAEIRSFLPILRPRQLV